MIPIARLVKSLALPITTITFLTSTQTLAQGGDNPVNITAINIEPAEEHRSYQLYMELGGEDLYWTVTESGEVTQIRPDEGYESGLGGSDPVYTGTALDNQAHRLDGAKGMLVPAVGVEQHGLPHAFKDVFDNPRQILSTRVETGATGNEREIAGHTAAEHRLALISEMVREDDDDPYHMVTYGSVWMVEDLPFSYGPLQISNGIFSFLFAPSATPSVHEHYQQALADALSPLGLLAGARLREFMVEEPTLEQLEAQGWIREEDQRLGQQVGNTAYEILMTDFSTSAAPFDYTALQNTHATDAATLEYLETPVMLASILDVCPALPEQIPTDQLQDMMRENASFQGNIEGSMNADMLGEAAFGRQSNSFALTLEGFDGSLEQAACLIMMRVGDGVPEAVTTLDVSDSRLEPGDMMGDLVAFLILADVSQPGEIRHTAVGTAFDGEVVLDSIDEDQISGQLSINGVVTPLEALEDSAAFEYSGEFTARFVWDNIPAAVF